MPRSKRDTRTHFIVTGASEVACGLKVTPSRLIDANPTCVACQRRMEYLKQMRDRLKTSAAAA